MSVDREELAWSVALSDYWREHPERPREAREGDLVTRANMRRRVRQAHRHGFEAGQQLERKEGGGD